MQIKKVTCVGFLLQGPKEKQKLQIEKQGKGIEIGTLIKGGRVTSQVK